MPMPSLNSQMPSPNMQMPKPGLQIPNQSTQTNQANSQPRGRGSQVLTEERLHEVLDEREEKKKEKEKEDWIREMITKQQQLVENLNDRVTALEKNPPSPAQGGEGEGDIINEKAQEAIADVIHDRIKGEEGGELTKGDVREIVKSESPSPEPSGERNEYDMEVEKAKQRAEARKIEAEERRKGFKEIADAIKDTADNIGWSIGESVARGGERSSNPGQSQSGSRTQMQNQDYFEPKPVRKLDDGSRVMEGCPFKDCDYEDDIEVEEGKTTTTCPECDRVLTIPAAE